MGASKIITIGAVVIVLLGGGWYLFSNNNNDAMMEHDGAAMEDNSAMVEGDGVMTKDEGAMMEGDSMMEKGTYEPYSAEKVAAAGDDKVLLFFHAEWCPICRPLDADIKAHLSDIPSNITILKVNYDTETALKKKYGVTYQHTIVEVDSKGNMIKKWSAENPTLSAVLAQVK